MHLIRNGHHSYRDMTTTSCGSRLEHTPNLAACQCNEISQRGSKAAHAAVIVYASLRIDVGVVLQHSQLTLSEGLWSASKTCPALEQDMTENRDRFLDAGRQVSPTHCEYRHANSGFWCRQCLTLSKRPV